MTTAFTRCFRRTQQGSIAVETALVMPILILFLAAPLFLARVFWVYSVAEKAAHDSARFLSQVSRVEIQSAASGAEPGVTAIARAIANAELDEIRRGAEVGVPTVLCDGLACDGFTLPIMVRVGVRIRVRDTFFGLLTAPIFGPDGLVLTADVTMRYAGN